MSTSMRQQFYHIASIGFHHEYRGDGFFGGLSVTWSTDSKKGMDNLEVLVKPFTGGINVFCSDPELLKEERESIVLRLSPADPYFFNFTDLGSEHKPNTRVFVFSDQGLEPPKSTLHSGEFATAVDSLEILSQKVLGQLLPRLNDGVIFLYDSWGNQMPIRDYARYFTESGELVFYAGDEQKRVGYFKPSQAMERPPFGIICLMPHILYERFRLKGEATSYRVRFRARRTYWKYILSDKTLDKFSRLSVIDIQKKEIHFKEGEFEIQPEWKVRSFESDVEIPFNADYDARFQLIERSRDENQAGKVIYRHLPQASPEQLYPLPTNTDILFSHIFI